MKRAVPILVAGLLVMMPFVMASPVKLWSYSDTCAVFSMDINGKGYIGLAFGYYAELLSPEGKLVLKAPTRGIAYSTALSESNVLLVGTEGSWVQAFKNSKSPVWEHKLRNAVVSVSISGDGLSAAGDASGYVYLFMDGKPAWEQKVGDYVWSVILSNGTLYVGSDSGISAFSMDGKLLWSKTLKAAVRKVLVAGEEIVVLLVPESEGWSEVIAFTPSGTELWKKHITGYVRAISSDGKNIAIAGSFGNVTLLSLDGNVIYSVPLIGYAYDVATRAGYTLVSFGKEAELIAPNGTVVWFQRFNGTAYHVAFSSRGYFLTEYGSHDVQNCYSVITAWSLEGSPAASTISVETAPKLGVNPYFLGVLIGVLIALGALLWRKR